MEHCAVVFIVKSDAEVMLLTFKNRMQSLPKSLQCYCPLEEDTAGVLTEFDIQTYTLIPNQ